MRPPLYGLITNDPPLLLETMVSSFDMLFIENICFTAFSLTLLILLIFSKSSGANSAKSKEISSSKGTLTIFSNLHYFSSSSTFIVTLNLLKVSGWPKTCPSKSVGIADKVLFGACLPNAITSLILFASQLIFDVVVP